MATTRFSFAVRARLTSHRQLLPFLPLLYFETDSTWYLLLRWSASSPWFSTSYSNTQRAQDGYSKEGHPWIYGKADSSTCSRAVRQLQGRYWRFQTLSSIWAFIATSHFGCASRECFRPINCGVWFCFNHTWWPVVCTWYLLFSWIKCFQIDSRPREDCWI